MATDIEICSNALMLLGDAPIASLTEQTKRATLCANLYPLARADVLRQHVWNGCVKRVILSPLTAAPAFRFRYQFALPGDFLRLIEVGDDDGQPYQFEGGRVLADTSVLYLRYVADVTEGGWDSLLVDVMVKRMAKDLAYPITKSGSMAQLRAEEYERSLRRAKSVDGMENPPEEWNDSPFLQVRG